MNPDLHTFSIHLAGPNCRQFLLHMCSVLVCIHVLSQGAQQTVEDAVTNTLHPPDTKEPAESSVEVSAL